MERLWPGRTAGVTQLGGGITNHNFKITVDNESFVLRIGGKDTELLGIDRAHEHAASVLAASLGVGPEVVAFLEPEGYLVTRFVEGTPVPADRMPVVAVGETLRFVHGAGSIPSRFDSFRVVEAYRDTEANARHRDTAHFKKWFETVADMFVEPRTRVMYDCIFPDDDGWPPYRPAS